MGRQPKGRRGRQRQWGWSGDVGVVVGARDVGEIDVGEL